MKKTVEYDDKLLVELHRIAYNYALYRVGRLDVAEDIASQAIYSYLLKREQITHENHEGWIINASKNYCKQYFDQQKSEKELQNVLTRNLADGLQKKIFESVDFVDQEKNNLYDAVKDVKENLTERELETYIYYLQCDRNIKKMHRATGESYSALRQRISRINRKIKAETFQKIGVIATKKILTPQINNIIAKFLLRFKKHLDTNTLDKMFYYFSKKDLRNYKPQFDINKVLDYEVRLRNSAYIIDVVFNNKKGESESFRFSFTVENNALKILQPPTPHQEHFKLSAKDAEKVMSMLNKFPEDSTGVHHVPDDDLTFLRRMLGEEDE